MPTTNLPTLRARIDELDVQIQTLINQRAQIAQEVAEAKRAQGDNTSFYRPEREVEVLRQVIERNQGPLSNHTVAVIFREIMSACMALQKPLSVAFLGPLGTYSQTAMQKHFGHAAQTVPLPTIDEVFREVVAGSAQYGVVPVENSTEGGVNQTLDCFISTPLKICGEVELSIQHHLLSLATDFTQIKRIYSHQQSLAQCRMWLDTHLPNVERLAVNSNAEAARRAANEPTAAAIAGQTAAEIYQLQILASRIENDANNTTRFAVLGKQTVPPTGKDKTSLLVTTLNQPGTLYHLLEPLATHNISMTRIESRPSHKGLWEYVFFIDIEGHIEDTVVAEAMQALQTRASVIKHLGSYPRAVP